METVSQLLACFGPPLLMVMGIGLCLAYQALWRGRWAVLAAFLIVGVPVSVAAFLTTRPAGVSSAPTSDNVAHVRSTEATGAGERHMRSSPSREVRTVYETVPQTPQRMNRGRRHTRTGRSGTRAVVLVIPPQSHANATSTNTAVTRNASKIPPNTLSCTGFTRDPDGTWEAGDNTQPFDVGSDTGYTIRDEGPIRQDWLSVGGTDLYDLLNAKCAVGAKSSR